MVELNQYILSSSVSTVVNRDVKQFGKKFLFDGKDDTCWNSDQGDVQHIIVKFDKEVLLTSIHIQFQGGFSCKQFDVVSVHEGDELVTSCYPEDINVLQKFEVKTEKKTCKIRLKFLKNTDFFGRIIVYHLKFFGIEG